MIARAFSFSRALRVCGGPLVSLRLPAARPRMAFDLPSRTALGLLMLRLGCQTAESRSLRSSTERLRLGSQEIFLRLAIRSPAPVSHSSVTNEGDVCEPSLVKSRPATRESTALTISLTHRHRRRGRGAGAPRDRETRARDGRATLNDPLEILAAWG